MAKRKLALIIEREGDLNGERRKPYYLNRIIEETIRAHQFSKTCSLISLEIKKEMPAAEAAGQI